MAIFIKQMATKSKQARLVDGTDPIPLYMAASEQKQKSKGGGDGDAGDEKGEGGHAMQVLAGAVEKVYFGGDLEAGVALTGQIAGRIDAVKPVAQVFEETVREFAQAVESLSKVYGR